MPAFLTGVTGTAVPRLSPARFSHFYAPLALLAGGLVAARQPTLNEFFTSLFNVLPTVLLLLGGAFCIAYARVRETFLLLTVYIVYFLLDTQVDHYRLTGSPARFCQRLHSRSTCAVFSCRRSTVCMPFGKSVHICCRTVWHGSLSYLPFRSWRWPWRGASLRGCSTG